MSRGVLLNPVERWWKCASCGLTDRTTPPGAYTQMHHCPALNGIAIALIEVHSLDDEVKARHRLIEREDYIGQHGGQRVAAIATDYADGRNDVLVFAPTASVNASA